MDTIDTGRFIAELRRERGLTQAELAEKLSVTNKAVSRWETGAGFPDVDSMLALSDCFGVSVNELLQGKRSAPQETDDEKTVEELKKKEAAQIACGSLGLSVKKRRSTRAVIIMAAVLTLVVLLSCVLFAVMRRPKPEPNVMGDNELWFCPLTVITDSVAKVINIKTGEVFVACPDPLCSHSASSETCFFNYAKDKTLVFGAAYAEGHICFMASKNTADGTNMKLYDFSANENKIEEVYSYEYKETSAQIYTNGHEFFFTAIIDGGSIADNTANIALYAYDFRRHTVTLLDDHARYALYRTDVAFFDEYYIHSAGKNEEADRIRYCKRSYDGKTEEYFETLPDGTPLEIFGYQLKSSGYFINTEERGGVYLWDENRVLAFPTESAATVPAVYKDSFYFTTRGTELVELGWDPVSRSKVKGYPINNEVYVVNKDGTYKHYSVDSEYHFVIKAACENIIIGSIDYRIKENGDYIGDNSYDYIRINLETGETTLYDTSRRSGFAVKTFVTDVKLNDD